MADSCGDNNNTSPHTRQSTVYAEPEKQGFLEKKSSGMIRSKTSPRWCYVQGSYFYDQKTKQQRVDEVQVIDMTNVQLVRKVNTDMTETQFEIIKKKTSQIYLCTNRQECTDWIRALQTAMTIKHRSLKRENSNSTFYPVSEEVNYTNTTDEQTNSTGNTHQQTHSPTAANMGAPSGDKSTSSSCLKDFYSFPQDSVRCEGTAAEGVYSDVQEDEDRTSSASAFPRLSPCSSPTSHKPTILPRYKVSSDSADGRNGASVTEAVSKESVVSDSGYKMYRKKSKDSSRGSFKSYVKISTETVGVDQNSTAIGSGETFLKEPVNVEDKHLEEILSMLDGRTSPVRDLDYTLNDDDTRPLRELKCCLDENEFSNRFSSNRYSGSTDPVSACRSFLSQLENVI